MIDPTHDYEYTRGVGKLDMYGALYWYEYGLTAALENMDARLGIAGCIGEYGRCGLAETMKGHKKTIKDYRKMNKAASKWNKKDTAKYKARVLDALPERLPTSFLVNYLKENGDCGMTADMKAAVFKYELENASPEVLARQERCEIAYDNLYAIKGTNPEIVSMKDTLWGHRYLSAKKEGRFCEEPSQTLLNNAFASSDPYVSMPLDLDRPEHFRQFTPSLDFSAMQPLQSECEASLQGGTLMFEISPLAKPKPDEAAWMAHYKDAQISGGMCNPIPKRLAEWGEDYVWQNGWPFAYDANTAKLDTCMEAVRVVANDGLGGEFARWVQGYNMRIDYPDTRRPSGDICQGIPKPLQADLFPRMEAAREIRREEQASRQRQLETDYANAPPPPPSFGEIVRQWQKDWQARPVIVERCYTNQFGRYVCYDKTYR